jgi:hypothetical protein
MTRRLLIRGGGTPRHTMAGEVARYLLIRGGDTPPDLLIRGGVPWYKYPPAVP